MMYEYLGTYWKWEINSNFLVTSSLPINILYYLVLQQIDYLSPSDAYKATPLT